MTGVKWTLYETEDDPSTQLTKELTVDQCKLVEDTKTGNTGERRYYYTNDGQPYNSNDEIDNSKDCTATTIGIEKQLTGKKIASGTIANAQTTVVDPEDGSIAERTIKEVSDTTGKKLYYYLVVEYPNQNSSQATEMGQTDVNISLGLVNDSAVAITHKAG